MFPTLFGAFSPKRSDIAPGQDRGGKGFVPGRESTEPATPNSLRPEGIELLLEDGLLMALGPDGDPVPPAAFAAMASECPEATVRLASGGRVPVEKAAAVLQMQASGKTIPGEQANRWTAAMLGLGPRPEQARPEELSAEADAQPSPRESDAQPSPREADSRARLGVDSDPEGGASSIPLRIVPPCPDGLDAGQVSLVVLSGLPEGCVLSAGVDEGGGRWLLAPADLDELLLQVPRDGPESMTIEVTSLGVADRNGDLVVARADLGVTCRPVPPTLRSGPEAPNPLSGSIGLDIELGPLADLAVDVLVLRGVPAGFTLSAGIRDASIDAWVLKPAEIEGLRMHPADGGAAAFTVTVLGVGLGRDAPRQAREIARIPIVLD